MADNSLLSVRFEMRATPQWVEAVDRWRAKQPGIPSRAESIRRIVDAGLSNTGEPLLKIEQGSKRRATPPADHDYEGA